MLGRIRLMGENGCDLAVYEPGEIVPEELVLWVIRFGAHHINVDLAGIDHCRYVAAFVLALQRHEFPGGISVNSLSKDEAAYTAIVDAFQREAAWEARRAKIRPRFRIYQAGSAWFDVELGRDVAISGYSTADSFMKEMLAKAGILANCIGVFEPGEEGRIKAADVLQAFRPKLIIYLSYPRMFGGRDDLYELLLSGRRVWREVSKLNIAWVLYQHGDQQALAKERGHQLLEHDFIQQVRHMLEDTKTPHHRFIRSLIWRLARIRPSS